MNDRKVIIDHAFDTSENNEHDMNIDFTDKFTLSKAFDLFFQNTGYPNLKIKVSGNFAEACEAFNNMFTRVEAAGGIVRNNEKEFLFIKRLGLWDLPKGKLHKKEHARAGALREVAEETGLTNLNISKQLKSTYHIYIDRNGVEVLKETFWFEMICHKAQKLVPQLDEDITEVKWFSETDFDIPFHNTYASLQNLLDSYLRSISGI